MVGISHSSYYIRVLTEVPTDSIPGFNPGTRFPGVSQLSHPRNPILHSREIIFLGRSGDHFPQEVPHKLFPGTSREPPFPRDPQSRSFPRKLPGRSFPRDPQLRSFPRKLPGGSFSWDTLSPMLLWILLELDIPGTELLIPGTQGVHTPTYISIPGKRTL